MGMKVGGRRLIIVPPEWGYLEADGYAERLTKSTIVMGMFPSLNQIVLCIDSGYRLHSYGHTS